ncbi:NepR family anti-sigma factor [Paracoccus sp. DMF-8]|uniref:NepR family anti-sigma factor n=1 Tax=Paracoccus sp. DMF-8 TaxID=3019445 RepID=UPI0023E812EF|nr:NepR family anti-sigma factor [Paracoccus sp. DMF-8]MDF3605169.1 NepR family anti-sigma factor [Paracoccus sp. DMF-8]
MEPYVLLTVETHGYKFLGIKKMNKRREERRRAEIEKQIDENLRRVYDEDTQQDVPDRFKLLLEQLRGQATAE